ncbi:hypothetical protein [Acidovorax sp. A1169]|uniref:hypothetical protein n=1 Tax=Acidovorax sp. A1169 TaxID=3059524 RepID=UPI002737AAA4|nr:hypothetical protein [Acidovorax sp. A1169]MDP4075224.1 hypothetical protein [Acidovorax sp. A1169]
MAHPHMPAPDTMATFAAWLAARQQRALQGMQGSTGEAFGVHCDAFAALAAVHRVVQQFEGEQAGQVTLCAPIDGRA